MRDCLDVMCLREHIKGGDCFKPVAACDKV